jgi:predicted O-methyltransferase YrrM
VTEPAYSEEVAAWIAAASGRRDPFEDVRLASHEHRSEHGWGCTIYPTSSGPLLGLLARAIEAARVLEVGTGLGYSALWLAAGGAAVETIERDPLHAELARALDGPYDLVFCDADPVGYVDLLEEFVRLVRAGGLLVSANLFLAQFADDIRGLDELARYRELLVDDERVQTAFVPGGMALSLRR